MTKNPKSNDVDFKATLWKSADKLRNQMDAAEYKHIVLGLIFLKYISLKNINLGATFLFLSILCSIKIERLLFLKFLNKMAFFDSYFWPFNKTHEKIIAIFVISAIMASI